MAIITLKNPKIVYSTTTIEFERELIIDDITPERSEYIYEDQNSNKSIYKKGNRKNWNFNIYQIRETNDEFTDLINSLRVLNGKIVKFYPNTIDTPTTYYESYLIAYDNKYSENPAWFIKLNLIALDL